MKTPKRILVVDDEPGDTRILKIYLEERGDYLVLEENHARSAVSAAEEFEPNLILLDVIMPEMDGRELAASFRAHPKLKGVPIVFLTSAITKEEADAVGGRLGGFPFLAKPIVLNEVAACLKIHAARSGGG